MELRRLAVPANAVDPRQFVTATHPTRPSHAGPTTVSGDCRELRLVVPSDPSDPRSVTGQATVTRESAGRPREPKRDPSRRGTVW